jgi:hypothetical protein
LNSKSVLFNDSSDPSKIIDVSSANWEISCSECKTLIPFILGFSLSQSGREFIWVFSYRERL